MGGKKFIPKSNKNYFLQAKLQQKKIEKHFDCFDCKVAGDKLTCKGKLKPDDTCEEYTVKIDYDLKKVPKVYIQHPQIEYNEEIHMYKKDNSLCLYYPQEAPWNNDKDVFDTIIPWTAEWLIYYELYKWCGVWLGKSHAHSGAKNSDRP